MSETFQEFCKRILPVVQAGADGKKIQTKPRDREHWNPVGKNCGVLRRCLEYRIAEPKATPLPITPEMWAMINPFYACAVMNDYGEVLFCSQVTEWSDDVRKFGCEYGFGDNCKSPLSIDTTGIIPELSLTKRPDFIEHGNEKQFEEATLKAIEKLDVQHCSRRSDDEIVMLMNSIRDAWANGVKVALKEFKEAKSRR